MLKESYERWILVNSSVVGFGTAAVVAAEAGITGRSKTLAVVALGVAVTATMGFFLNTAHQRVGEAETYTDDRTAAGARTGR